LPPPAAMKARATRPERIQRVMRRPLSVAAGRSIAVIIKDLQVFILTSIYLMSIIRCVKLWKGFREMQDTSGVHVWLVLGKAFQALAGHAEESLKLSQVGLGDSEFRALE